MDIPLITHCRVHRKRFSVENVNEPSHVFALVEEGSFLCTTQHGTYTVRPGEGFVFRKGQKMRRSVLEPVTLYLFRYDCEDPLFMDEHIIFEDRQRVNTTIHILNLLDENVYRDDFAQRAHLLADLVMQYRLQKQEPLLRADIQDEPIRGAITYLERHAGENCALSRLAEDTGLSYAQFFRRFRNCTGMTPSAFLAVVRLNKAKAMLLESTLSVREIAFACGFENEYYFSNFFKKHTGLSPTHFRRI